MGQIEIIRVRNRNELKKFIHLPAFLHTGHHNWVPPVYVDEWRYFNPKKNRGFAYCDTIIALARLDGKIVGRIMGIINNRYNAARNEKHARFSFLDCINNNSVSSQLLSFVEEWAKSKGMTRLIGPFGMYYQDPTGFMIEGFDTKPSLSANYNYEYIISLLQAAGYESESDLVVYKIDIPEVFPDFYIRIRMKAEHNPRLKLIKFSSRKEIRDYLVPILSLMNDCYTDIYGYSQLDAMEMKDLADHYIPLLDPKFVVVVTYEDDVVGFMIAMPSMNEGIIASKGYLWPFGFLKILKASKESKQLDFLLGGIKDKYRGMGIDVLMALHMIETAKKAGFTVIDTHLELESNWKIRAEMEKMGGRVYKRYRIFGKNLTAQY